MKNLQVCTSSIRHTCVDEGYIAEEIRTVWRQASIFEEYTWIVEVGRSDTGGCWFLKLELGRVSNSSVRFQVSEGGILGSQTFAF